LLYNRPFGRFSLKLNGRHKPLACADDVNLLGDNIDNTNKNTDTLTDPGKKVGLEVNTEKTKYILLSYHQTAKQNHNIKTENTSFKNLA
jgi:hypothetical protein